MNFKIFVKKKGCPKCQEVLKYCKTLKDKGIRLELFDLDTVDGLAEASYYGLLSVPIIIAVNGDGEELKKYMNLEDFDRGVG